MNIVSTLKPKPELSEHEKRITSVVDIVIKKCGRCQYSARCAVNPAQCLL